MLEDLLNSQENDGPEEQSPNDSPDNDQDALLDNDSGDSPGDDSGDSSSNLMGGTNNDETGNIIGNPLPSGDDTINTDHLIDENKVSTNTFSNLLNGGGKLATANKIEAIQSADESNKTNAFLHATRNSTCSGGGKRKRRKSRRASTHKCRRKKTRRKRSKKYRSSKRRNTRLRRKRSNKRK
jgi:hypothetical protein